MLTFIPEVHGPVLVHVGEVWACAGNITDLTKGLLQLPGIVPASTPLTPMAFKAFLLEFVVDVESLSSDIVKYLFIIY
jgi:hypothetical protein